MFLKFGNSFLLGASVIYLFLLLFLDKGNTLVAVFGSGFAVCFLFYAFLSFLAYIMLSEKVYGRIALYYFTISLVGLLAIYVSSQNETQRVSKIDIKHTILPQGSLL
jgi:hypothetical protein